MLDKLPTAVISTTQKRKSMTYAGKTADPEAASVQQLSRSVPRLG
jgi:hypothetical protein